ncbi:MAG: TetR/AcrR family transcriptional regulator [Nannocystaceae bacterium]|nr:TetR/AcrR family transcriptional regulator [Nannocystaceae bacterium]
MAQAYHHGDLKQALLDAALALISEHGISAVTMSKVATRTGVSSGAPYRHFKDRMALLRALSVHAQSTFEARFAVVTADAPNPKEAFRRIGVEYVRFAVAQPAMFAVLSRGDLIDRDTDVPNSEDAAFLIGLEKLLADGDPDAPLDANNPLIQQLAARCMMHGLAHFFVDGLLGLIGVGPDQAVRVAEALAAALNSPNSHDRFVLPK